MAEKFHEKPFDEATLTKLDLFRLYLRSALPVFINESKKNPNRITSLNIYDFFAGPGMDCEGNHGSPLIIVEELKGAWVKNLRDSDHKLAINIFFNDYDSQLIEKLEDNIKKISISNEICNIKFSSGAFREELPNHLSTMKGSQSANVVFLDQLGITGIVPEDIIHFTHCSWTDILFFISSSFAKRFPKDPGFQESLGFNPKEIDNTRYQDVHRFICNLFRNQLPSGTKYHLAPFSLKKNKSANIYGLVFGSGNLYGLEKFLEAC